jgi:uncharacterized Fe-S cluster-containing radical SAM superfamily protein
MKTHPPSEQLHTCPRGRSREQAEIDLHQEKGDDHMLMQVNTAAAGGRRLYRWREEAVQRWREEAVQVEEGGCTGGGRRLYSWREEAVQVEGGGCTGGGRRLYRWREEAVQGGGCTAGGRSL